MRTSIRQRSARSAALVTAIAAVLVLSATSASATTMTRPLCNGTVQLTAVDGPDGNKIRVTERAVAGSGSLLIGVRYGLTWRNQRSGASGSVPYAVAEVDGPSWQRSWTITTGPGNVIVDWDYTVSQPGWCVRRGTLEASAFAQ